MNEPPREITGGLGLPEHWGRLASITRTWSWLSARPGRVQSLPYVGSSCARLVVEALAALDEEAPQRAALVTLNDRLQEFDSLEAEAREEAIPPIVEALTAFIAPSIQGLRLPPHAVRGKLIVPRRSRGRRGQRGRDEAESGASAQEHEESPQVTASGEEGPQEAPGSESPSTHAEDEHATRTAGSPAANVEPQEAETAESAPLDDREREFQALLKEARRTRRPPRDRDAGTTRRLFGHAEGTGRPVGVLQCLAPDELSTLVEHGFESLTDLMNLVPKEFTHPARVDLSAPDDSEPGVVRGQVESRCSRWTRAGRRDELVLVLGDDTRVACRWLLRRPRGFRSWSQGMEIALVGELLRGEEDGFVLLEAEPAGMDGRGSGALPVYGVGGVEDRLIRRAVAEAIELNHGRIKDWMPRNLINGEQLLSLENAVRDAHFPGNSHGRGRERLAFDELFLLQLGVAWKSSLKKGARGIGHRLKHERIGKLSSQPGMRLTDGQELAFDEIRRDLRRHQPMRRLLQGDVGAGKGRVALFSSILVAGPESQVVLIFDDALAAERAYAHAEPLLRSLGVSSGIVTASPDRAQIDALKRGEFHMVYGTVDLLDAAVEWRCLGLVVAIESSGQGTVLPSHLSSRDRIPDLLVQTRSPLPMRLVLTRYSAFELTTLPSDGAGSVHSELVGGEARKEAYADAAAAVMEGRQVYVVFPVRDGKDLLSSQDAKRMADALRSETFPSAAIGVYSSSMSRDERHRVFEDFLHRRVDVLVSTTFIEDAPEVFNASVMMVEYADLHSSERLHRLRGHVASSPYGGRCCLMLSDSPESSASERLSRFLGERDGFRLAELDLDGQIERLVDEAREGVEQPPLRWVGLGVNRSMMIRARQAAFKLLQNDPNLRSSGDMVQMLNERWGEWLGEPIPLSGGDRKGGSRGRRRPRRRRRR